MRALLAVLAVALAASAAPAGAAPKPPCKILTDAPNDVYVLNSAPSGKYQDDALDILSADLAADTTRVTAVIRLAKLSATPASAPAGAWWNVTWETAADNRDYFEMRVTVARDGAVSYLAGFRSTSIPSTFTAELPAAKGFFDPARNEVRVTAPLSQFAPMKLKKGEKLLELTANSARDGVRTSLKSDHAGPISYVLGTPSCAKVGA